MTFVSVQQEDLLTDITKTWIKFLKDNISFTGITYKVDTPDTDIDLQLPLIVLKRVSNDSWDLNRNGGYFGTLGSTSTIEKQLYGYTLSSLFQFDIMTKSITDCNKIQGKITQLLKPLQFGNKTHIPLRHFTGTDSVGTTTNLSMKFSFQKDVDSAVLSTFDPSLHQHSVSVRFSLDYLSEQSITKIKGINPSYNIT